jgi:hypothetical protein
MKDFLNCFEIKQTQQKQQDQVMPLAPQRNEGNQKEMATGITLQRSQVLSFDRETYHQAKGKT